jgi:hypothetical protein
MVPAPEREASMKLVGLMAAIAVFAGAYAANAQSVAATASLTPVRCEARGVWWGTSVVILKKLDASQGTALVEVVTSGGYHQKESAGTFVDGKLKFATRAGTYDLAVNANSLTGSAKGTIDPQLSREGVTWSCDASTDSVRK